jgi:hypothetical protein
MQHNRDRLRSMLSMKKKLGQVTGWGIIALQIDKTQYAGLKRKPCCRQWL